MIGTMPYSVWRECVKPGEEPAVLQGLDRWLESREWTNGHVHSPETFLRERMWTAAPDSNLKTRRRGRVKRAAGQCVSPPPEWKLPDWSKPPKCPICEDTGFEVRFFLIDATQYPHRIVERRRLRWPDEVLGPGKYVIDQQREMVSSYALRCRCRHRDALEVGAA
jgi:hypothetical protein